MERKGYIFVKCKMIKRELSTIQEHYSHLADDPYYKDLVNTMIDRRMMAMVWVGPGAIRGAR